ncbi:MAG: phospholipase [Rhodospirillales bacterium]|nr:phospholipase [Rhodospirillales bacterium]
MSDLPILQGPALPPASGGAPKQLVVLLHGVGADGNDLIGLAPYFQQVLPEALFVSPNAPYSFDMAPFGYQWFSIQDFRPETRLTGVRSAAPIVDRFLDTLLGAHGLDDAQMALIGFSQGTMMSLHVGLRRERTLAGILGYSGMLVGGELLKEEIKSKPPVRLIHGDADEILPVDSLPAAVEGLEGAGVMVDSFIRPGLGHGIDEEGIRLGQTFLADIFGVSSK